MAELDRIAGALRLGPVDAARLAGWKAWQSGMRGLELRTGHGGYHAVAAAYGERWAKRWGAEGVVGWLHRAGGGRLFLDCSDAAEWGRTTCTQADLELAESSAAGVFDLIGSGPRSLGVPPSWRTDLYSGLEWPLEQSHGLRFVRGDGSDIRTVWELSRGYHFIALARAYWSTGDVRFVHAFITHVDSWIEQNPFGRGPHWASPMDAAVRAANWTLGLLLFAPVGELDAAFVQRLLSNLYATGLHVERHREWHPVYRGNHYVANGVGLAYLGALFRGERLGERWLRRGTRIIADELLRQVHPDGVSFEASLGYHRFATQLFSWGAALVRANAPGRWTRAHDERLAAMYDFIETYLPASGLAPLLGDNDDGHLHVMDARMLAEPRRHRLGLPGTGRAGAGADDLARPGPAEPGAAVAGVAESASRLYREGGFVVLRRGRDHCVIRCGPVGLNGAGSHDHNDQLSFELVIDGQRFVRDSGTYCYTRDLEQRFRFRSTAAHNALQLHGEEQNPILAERPWRVLEDRTRSRVTEWIANDGAARFTGVHYGYARGVDPLVVRRTVEWSLDSGWTITDELTGERNAADVAWRLHFDLPVTLVLRENGAVRLNANDIELHVAHPPGLAATLDEALSSPAYGVAERQAVLRVAGRCPLPVRIVSRVRGALHRVGRMQQPR